MISESSLLLRELMRVAVPWSREWMTSPLLIATRESIPLRGLEGVPGLPGAPKDEAFLRRKFET